MFFFIAIILTLSWEIEHSASKEETICWYKKIYITLIISAGIKMTFSFYKVINVHMSILMIELIKS